MGGVVDWIDDRIDDVADALGDVAEWVWDTNMDIIEGIADFALGWMMPDVPDMPNSATYTSSDRVLNTIKEGVYASRCYGRCKLGGNKLRFNAPDASDLRMIVGHCRGPVLGMVSIQINDIDWDDLTGAHTKTEYTGTRTQMPDSRFTEQASAYRSIAYTAFTFVKNDSQTGYNPNVTGVMEGLLCAPLAGGANAFTRNNSVILYDWYLNVEGYTPDQLDLDAFKSLEALCDEVPSGSTLPRYRFDFNFDSDITINDAKKLIWSSFNGMAIAGAQGKIKPVWDSAQMADGAGGLTAKTVAHAFDFDNIVKGSFSWQPLERANIVRIHFKDSENSYKSSSVEVRDEEDIEENGEILYEENAYYITDREIASRRAKLKFNRKRYADFGCKFSALSGAGRLELFDLVTVTHTRPGWLNKPFLVVSRGEDALGRLEFGLEAYYSGVYDDSLVGEQANYGTQLPNPYQAPASATNVAASMTAVGTAYDFDAVRVTFTPPDDPFYSHSEIYASNDDSAYYYIGSDSKGDYTFSALGIVYEPGDTCYIKLRSMSEKRVPGDLPATPSAVVVINSTMKIGGFYAGSDFLADSDNPADAKIYIDKTNTRMRLGPTTNPYLKLDGDRDGSPAVSTSNYTPGPSGSGMLLTPDILEVGNIAARGMIRTAVFQKDVVSAVGGNLAVLDADVLAANMTSDDSSSLVIEGNISFSVGDIVRIKAGTDDEWIEITGIASAPTYSVARDKAGSYDADTNPAWKKGASVINYGQSGDGGIYLTASDDNAPYVSVFTHNGSPWTGLSHHARLGNLNGFLSYVSDIYGIAIGDEDNYLMYDPVNGLRIKGAVAIAGTMESTERTTSGNNPIFKIDMGLPAIKVWDLLDNVRLTIGKLPEES